VMVVAAAQQPADAERWVTGPAAVSGGLLLHAAADGVDGVEPELDDVEGVQHPGRLGEGGPQRGGIPAEL